MRSLSLFLLPLLLAFLLLPTASASAGIRGPSLSELSYLFAPGEIHSATFSIYGSERLESFLKGDLAQYARIEDPNQNGSARSITVILTLPQTLPPGRHVLYVGTREAASEGMVGSVAAAQRIIVVQVLSDDPALVITSFQVNDIAVNTSETTATVAVKSLSNKNLSGVFADVSLSSMVDEKSTLLISGQTSSKSLPPGGEATFVVNLPVTGLVPGSYSALAVVHYAQNTTNKTALFRVGARDILLKTYPAKLAAGKLNKFVFSVTSSWNEELKVMGAVKLPGISEETPTVVLKPFSSGELKTYVDTSGLGLGPVEGTILLTFDGGKRSFPINLTIVNETLPAVEPEERSGRFSSLLKNPVVLLSLTLIFILFLFILFFVFRARKPTANTPETNGQ